MKKKHLLILFAALLPLVTNADDFEVNGIYYNITYIIDKTLEVSYKESISSDYSDEYSSSITIPATVTYDGVTYSVTSIGNHAFEHCSSLTDITLPESVTSIGDYAFYYCSKLTAITIPEGVTNIGYSAFSGCSSLTAITIPEGVTSIGNYAFSDCSSLTAITIPEGVTSIGEWAFSGCSSLANVYRYAETVPEYTSSYAFEESYIQNATLHIPANALETYKTTSPWNSFGNIVAFTEVSCTEIG